MQGSASPPTSSDQAATGARVARGGLAQFSLEGTSCFIVAEHSICSDVRPHVIGSMTLAGYRYAICSVAPAQRAGSGERRATLSRHPGAERDSIAGSAPTHDPVDQLTGRELQIAVLIAEGFHNKEIARRLGISPFTVGAHLARAYAKLGVSCRSALTARIVARMGAP